MLAGQYTPPSDLTPARTETNKVGTPEQSGDGSPKTVKVKGKSPPPKGGDGAQSSQAAPGAVGKSPKKQSGAYWKEGCLQSELMQFHLKKGLAAAGANKEPDNGQQPAEMEGWRAASGFQELQDEVEKLKEENESLKVRELSMAAIVCTCGDVMGEARPGCQLLDIHLALMSAAFISLQCLIFSRAAHLHHST